MMFSPNAFRSEGDTARDRRQWSAAEDAYRRHLNDMPEDADIWVQLGHAQKEQEKFRDAETSYRRAAELTPAELDPWLQLGHVLKRLDRPKQAAAAFREALRISPTQELLNELQALGEEVDTASVMENLPTAEPTNFRYLELKDLFQYLNQHATVTGITRVVLGLVNYVLEDMDEPEASSYAFVQQFGDAEGLLLIPKQKLRRLVRLAIAETSDLAGMMDLIAEIRQTSPLIKLKAGDLYFMPGAFWEFVANPGWLLSMKRNGVAIGSYIYDLIPLTHTHYCMSELTDAFNTAFSETARCCDFVLTISQYVADEVTGFLKKHDLPVFPTTAVPLAHELHFKTPAKRTTRPPSASLNSVVRDLEDRPFVLCVCTIEARKNHIYLFYIWQQMIDDGLDVPDLVFVGRPGWRVADLFGQIEASHYLDGRLHVLHGLTDAELSSLYEHCLFTVFPSFVEGWGLPVGESLTHGKICVASSTTSIPEVGGELAVYIDPFNLQSGQRVIQKLITDPQYRAGLEAKIKKFVPRTWSDVGKDFFAKLDRSMAALPPPEKFRQTFAPYLRAGRFTDMPWLKKAALRRAEYIGNPVRLIFAEGWRTLEVTGTWLQDRAGKLEFSSDYQPGRQVAILLQVSTSPWVTEKNRLRVWASGAQVERGEEDGDTHYARAAIPNERFWIRLRGSVGAGRVISVQFRVEGRVTASEPGAIPVSLRLHSIGFSAVDDYDARINLLEQTVLGS